MVEQLAELTRCYTRLLSREEGRFVGENKLPGLTKGVSQKFATAALKVKQPVFRRSRTRKPNEDVASVAFIIKQLQIRRVTVPPTPVIDLIIRDGSVLAIT